MGSQNQRFPDGFHPVAAGRYFLCTHRDPNFQGRASLGLGALVHPAGIQKKRLAFFLLAVVFVALIEWLGFSISVFGFVFCSLYLLEVRRPLKLWGIPFLITFFGYLLFIRLLDSRLPRGPVENLLEVMF